MVPGLQQTENSNFVLFSTTCEKTQYKGVCALTGGPSNPEDDFKSQYTGRG